MSSNSRPRKRLTAEQRRAAILAAALAVFADNGYHSSSIDDIARAAGISKALIYEHFESKQELYASLLDQEADELFARLASAVAGVQDAGAPRLETGLDAFFGFVEERREAWRMLFRENSDREAAARLDRVVAQVTEVVAALIAQDPGSHAVEQDAAQRGQAIRMLAQLLVGSVQSIANWWDDHRDVPRERVVEVVMDFAWVGLKGLTKGERWNDSPGERGRSRRSRSGRRSQRRRT
jgi:AcrR family transcriptional regulator